MAIDGPNPLGKVEGSRVFGAGAGESRFAPTEDLARWLATARQVPEVRQELVGEVARRLAAGELTTRAAAERVVQSLLESGAV